MANAAKILHEMRNNPRGWRIEDLKVVARHFGIEHRQNRTRHVCFRFPSGTFPVPAKRPINPVYVRKFAALMAEVSE